MERAIRITRLGNSTLRRFLLLLGRAFGGASVSDGAYKVHERADLIQARSVAVQEFLQEELLLDAVGLIVNFFREFQNHVA